MKKIIKGADTYMHQEIKRDFTSIDLPQSDYWAQPLGFPESGRRTMIS